MSSHLIPHTFKYGYGGSFESYIKTPKLLHKRIQSITINYITQPSKLAYYQ